MTFERILESAVSPGVFGSEPDQMFIEQPSL
jgi:hypothetical protein